MFVCFFVFTWSLWLIVCKLIDKKVNLIHFILNLWHNKVPKTEGVWILFKPTAYWIELSFTDSEAEYIFKVNLLKSSRVLDFCKTVVSQEKSWWKVILWFISYVLIWCSNSFVINTDRVYLHLFNWHTSRVSHMWGQIHTKTFKVTCWRYGHNINHRFSEH